ncbi:DMT family transporter [Paenibacillus aurantius]|uniref:DMT family transporter n=1 Tax=Paenibacillus aurantius TaxID=2918900 RepID=A0AA96RIF1_9BACL|nr:DMT family transporter [Paenibacillus aurantius]WJH37321.1 DMT family transporter [Paenibacillus sp. CC-CFT747]WNQ14353.1 DMT family transporter [Paenibacillus aurantius]
MSLLLVVASGLLHAVWSLFAKVSRNKSVFLWLIMAVATLVLLPVLVRELWVTPLPPEAYGFLLLSACLQGGYALLLARTYQMGDLSQVYPIMRGTSTLLIPLCSVLFLQESLSPFGWTGLAAMIAGFLGLSGFAGRSPAPGAVKPFLLALSVGVCTTCYVLVDRINLGYLSPLSLLEVTNLGFTAALTPIALRSKQLKEEWKAHAKLIVLGSVLNPGSYLLFLFALQLAPVAHISPVREIGTVFATILGIVVLKEKQGRVRILCSALILSGLLLIGFLG